MDSTSPQKAITKKEDILSTGEKWFKNFSDFLFENNKTFNDIIYTKIFYQVIDGKEYQLITLKSLFLCIDNEGFAVSKQEKYCIEYLSEKTYEDIIKVESIAKFLLELGIKENLPKSTKHLDYTQLDIGSIRLLNQINQFMGINQIRTVQDFIGKENIESYEVISTTKTEKIDIIPVIKLRDLLAKNGLFPFAQDLDDRFSDFLSVSLNEDFDELIMVRKLKKVLKDSNK
mmetsp:Transcript_14720/g.12951  ORF Transcript_14720/g.12951 Transcript_14720/m.12951 type:complete len:230 (+) Transcript_14720:193-882(+)